MKLILVFNTYNLQINTGHRNHDPPALIAKVRCPGKVNTDENIQMSPAMRQLCLEELIACFEVYERYLCIRH